MVADSQFSRGKSCLNSKIRQRYSNKANQLSWLCAERIKPLPALLLSLLFCLTSLATVAQTPDAGRHTIIHGLVVTAQGQPVAEATVEMRDLRGIQMAEGLTDSAGGFVIRTAAVPGEYVLLAAKELQIGDGRVTLDQSHREVQIAIPLASGSAVRTSQEMYTVSARELSVPAKARAHLRLAQREFGRLNFAETDKEIGQALQVDPNCAAAFSMEALLRLALRDRNGAIEDARRALAVDSSEVDAYVVLATAYNSLSEFEKAEAAAQRALDMRPDFWQGRLELAKAFYGQERLVLALRELDELNKDFPDVHLVRANILMRLNRSEEATLEFSQFLREAPNDPRREQVQQIVSRAKANDMPLPYPQQ
jgi:tetratricopeptide (TPR) repeat protein